MMSNVIDRNGPAEVRVHNRKHPGDVRVRPRISPMMSEYGPGFVLKISE